MTVFEKPGPDNTNDACRIAIERAMQKQAPIVASSTDGNAGVQLCKIAEEMGYKGKIIIVTHAYGSKEPGKNVFKDENREIISKYGVQFVTASHVLSGVERGLSSKFQGVYPAEIIAHALRMVCSGLKVAVEIGCMALDAGTIDYGKEVICMGGTGHGLDTVVVMSPSHAGRILETRVHEILCKPY